MASRSMSPGGALLRASRVFSIPPPLPRPGGDLSSQAIFTSDSATLPHPIHQTITTPQSSRARGDWGFKRPLPLRATTKTSTPFIRVEAIDTFEHITEFNSSADHALSLQKWQEMGVPLTVPVPARRGEFRTESRRSVFDSELDSTTAGQSSKEEHRWKFDGPWLAGQTEGQFNAYVATEVRKRKLEFQEYIRSACAKALTQEYKRRALAAGVSEEGPATIEASDITEEQLTAYIKKLRTGQTSLYALIRTFLDLPPGPPVNMSDSVLEMIGSSVHPQSAKGTDFIGSQSPYAASGPPKTHPSAGLAYSRTSQYLYNHPSFGPQQHKPPVKARVVMPRGAAVGSFAPALGVGGFVTEVPGQKAGFDPGKLKHKTKSSIIPGVQLIEPDKVGGSKVHVNTKHARIDPKGRVLLQVEVADADAVAVLEGTTDQIPVPSRMGPPGPQNVFKSTNIGSSPARRENSRGYGLDYGLSDIGEGPPRPKFPPAPATQEDANQALIDMMYKQR